MTRGNDRPPGRPSARRPRPAGRVEVSSPRAGWAAPSEIVNRVWGTGPLPAPAAGALAGVWALFTGLALTVVLTLVIWIFAAGQSASETAMRIGVDAWLVSHGVPIELEQGTWSLLPTAWLLLPAVIAWLAGSWVAQRCALAHPRSIAAATATLAAVYGFGALLAALFGTLSGLTISPPLAVAHAVVVTAVFSAAAMLVRTGVGRNGWAEVWPWIRPGIGAVMTVVGGSAALALVVLLFSMDALWRSWSELAPGVVGGAALVVLWIGYLPTFILWALGYSLGTGFTAAGQRWVPWQAPEYPPAELWPLSVLPTTDQPLWLAAWVIPVGAGVVLAALVTSGSRWQVVTRLAAGLATAAVVMIVWLYTARGTLGAGQIRVVGPTWWLVVGTLGGMVVGCAGWFGARWLRARRSESVIDLTDSESEPESEAESENLTS